MVAQSTTALEQAGASLVLVLRLTSEIFHRLKSILALPLAAVLLAGCLTGSYALGREYVLVGECDRVWSLAPDTLFCQFDGYPPDGARAFAGIVPFPTGAMRVISARGLYTPKRASIRALPEHIVTQCPPPARKVYPISAAEEPLLHTWEVCVDAALRQRG
jgi:hypothetical protein